MPVRNRVPQPCGVEMVDRDRRIGGIAGDVAAHHRQPRVRSAQATFKVVRRIEPQAGAIDNAVQRSVHHREVEGRPVGVEAGTAAQALLQPGSDAAVPTVGCQTRSSAGPVQLRRAPDLSRGAGMTPGPLQIGAQERYRRSRQFPRPQHDGQPLDIGRRAGGHDPCYPARRAGRRIVRYPVEPHGRLIVVDPDGLDRQAGGAQGRLDATLGFAPLGAWRARSNRLRR